MHKVVVTTDEVKKIAKLANLTLQNNEEQLFAQQFSNTIEVVNELNKIDTTGVIATYQVNGLSNIVRDDVVDPQYTLTQSQALSQAKESHEGFFVVKRLIDTDTTESVI
jgi:aspartyl-tRNA(Asn)/glutamyl-tRNA(Gln) amidotransferase subunit C